jgi:hypothetical protein
MWVMKTLRLMDVAVDWKMPISVRHNFDFFSFIALGFELRASYFLGRH